MPRHAITITRVFAAAHAIRLYDGRREPLHGHNWEVEVTVGAARLDAIEVVMDFHLLERLVTGILDRVHNSNLNDHPPFADRPGKPGVNPTAERVAWWIATEVKPALPRGTQLLSVSVTEAPGCKAIYQP